MKAHRAGAVGEAQPGDADQTPPSITDEWALNAEIPKSYPASAQRWIESMRVGFKLSREQAETARLGLLKTTKELELMRKRYEALLREFDAHKEYTEIAQSAIEVLFEKLDGQLHALIDAKHGIEKEKLDRAEGGFPSILAALAMPLMASVLWNKAKKKATP